MPHVDEGTLHALLDGELAPDELAEVRLHFATCPSCAGRLDEARHLLAETERLVSALQMPGAAGAGAAARVAAGVGARPATADRPPANVLLGPPAPPGSPPPPLDPVVLIPENPTIREIRRSRVRLMAWAAGFLVVVGAGYMGVANFPRTAPNTDGRLRISADEFTTVPAGSEREGPSGDSVPSIALSDTSARAALAEADETPAKAKPSATAPESKRLAAAPSVPAAPAPAPAPQRAAPQPPAPQRAAASPPPSQPTVGQAANQRADAPAAATDSDARTAAAKDETPALAKAAESERQEAVGQNAARGAAAQATTDLDRRRMRERAAEATAALDRENAARRAAEERAQRLALERAAAERAQTERAVAAPAAAAPPDRTGISARIGLDEAARQLGGPLHAIDGLSRQAVGLVAGASVEGADPDRPVVRAVYVDRATGTTIFLDQQMARPGDGPATPTASPRGRQIWVKDGVLLILHGGVTADSLRSLARRVR